jgi:DNA-directed RNA polymerase I, II, and III subunit RPABC5
MKTSLIPIKCISCGKVLADKYRIYEATTNRSDPVAYLGPNSSEKTPQGHIMDALGLSRSCCRRHMLGHVST